MTSMAAILSRALAPREQQLRLAVLIDGSTRAAIAAQADTGTGKTAVLLSAAISHAKQGKRVIISTHTIQLLHQMNREASHFKSEGVSIGTRLGMRSFISAARVRNAWGRRSAAGMLTAEDEAGLSDLVAFAAKGSGLIGDYIEEFGDLPAGLLPQDIGLLPSARSADKAAWKKAKETASNYQVTIQTHALTLAQSRFGELPACVIFDEADALGDVADGAEDKRLSLAELAATLKYLKADQTPLTALLRSPSDVTLREQLAEQLKVKHEEEEVRLTLSSARWILTAHRLDGPRRGTEVRREGNDTVIRSLWADRSRWIWRNLTEAGVERAIFASATLAVGNQVALALRRFGVPSEAVDSGSFSPSKFGKMTFNIIAESAPPPIKGGSVNSEWQEAAADWLDKEGLTKSNSRPLILAKSYTDTGFFAERLGLTGHQRGHPLSSYVEQFRRGAIKGLVTPAGWVGLDLPGLITDLVILRLPYEGIDELKTQLIGRTDFPAIKAAMQRKLKQGLGRGIRKEDDEVRVWLADPRIHDMRNGIIAAIPERFRDAFSSALHKLRTTEQPVRPEQAAFRLLLLQRYGCCVVTGCKVEAALEAAHLPGRSWKQGHNKAEDGILVRADIHKLLDDNQMTIENGVLRVDALIASEYGQYDGRRILPG